MTIKQRWARERNWNKARIKGVVCSLRNIASDLSTTHREQGQLHVLADKVEYILDNWKGHEQYSRSYFLRRWRKKHEA
jgi:hypothetical protein